ncbi:unnamed protein product [Amaranthus hypochondriacus]
MGEGRVPVLHEVGGDRYGWRVNINFTNWASHQHFYVGDWLYFGFDKTKASVLEVNQTGYRNCIETNFITNITKGGRDVFNLTAARPYYFISGRGYCKRGIKLSITVQIPPPDNNTINPDPPSTKSPSSIIFSDATTHIFDPFHHFFIMIIISCAILA